MSEIINRVSNSGLITLDLETLMPSFPRLEIDLASQLWQGIALREDDFRQYIKNHDWAQYKESAVALHCSADAIIPHWAWMLVMSKLHGLAKRVSFGTLADLEKDLLNDAIEQLKPEDYTDARVVVKGCSKSSITPAAYMGLMQKLQPMAKSIMFGEPCSTVPVYKKVKA